MQDLGRDERGIAMITAILVTMVVLALGIVALQLATHSVYSSAYDRKRVQAIAAAEAGINAVYSRIQNSTPAQLADTTSATSSLCGTNPFTGNMAMDPTAQYAVTITYYGTYPPSGSPLACANLASTIAQIQKKNGSFAADITSVGTAVTSSTVNSVSRTLQAEVQLQPTTAFQKAIFSNGGFGQNGNLNNVTITGSDGANGNVYTNGDFGCNNGTTIQGSVYAQGTGDLENSCQVVGDLWTGGNITLGGNAKPAVGNDVTSSQGNLTITNPSTVGGSVKVDGTCTGCTGAVAGTVATGSYSAMPPQFAFPPLEWATGTANDYEPLFTAQGYAVDTSHTCSTLPSTLAANTVYVLSGSCSFAGQTFTVPQPSSSGTPDLGVAFIVDGSVSLAQKTTFQNAVSCDPTTTQCPFVSFIVPSNDVPGFTSAVPCPSPYNTSGAYDISANNNKNLTGLNVFAYTPCNVNFNNNSSNWYGQIYAGNDANIKNLYTQGYQQFPLLQDQAPIVAFTENIVFLREIVNG